MFLFFGGGGGRGAMSIFGILEGRDIKMRFKNRSFAVPNVSPMEDLNGINVVN